MQWFEHVISDQFFEVKPAGRSGKERFLDWILDDSSFEESPFKGGIAHARKKLDKLDVAYYSKTRNHLNGGVSQLSPYIEHGLVDPTEILKYIDSKYDRVQAYMFLKQLSWRDFFANRFRENPETVWKDLEDYKTGFQASDYSDMLPIDVLEAKTDVAVINQFILEMMKNGYLHNHARLYLASYIIHWRRIKWQVGARWMLKHLIDGNIASNNYSWQWVASTGSNKPYIFNLENIRKFASDEEYNLDSKNNQAIAQSYDALNRKLFPKLTTETGG
jgi:deoxyribodipyrimidine photo-lyase